MMVIIKCTLGIGFANAHQSEEIELDYTAEDWESLTFDQQQDVLMEVSEEWANNYIDIRVQVISTQ